MNLPLLEKGYHKNFEALIFTFSLQVSASELTLNKYDYRLSKKLNALII